MIYGIRGKLFSANPGEILLDIGNNLIITVFCPLSYYSKIKKDDPLFLNTVIKVKDEDILLYGFLTLQEKELFLKLISISGVGGKTALSFISAFSIRDLVDAINNQDINKVSSIPGIGRKTAQRIILELTGKLGFEEPEKAETVKLKDDLISGLVNLGYPVKRVKDLVQEALNEPDQTGSFEELFRVVIKKISRY